MNYYNEFDPFAAAWLRELIKAKVISEGEVDERSIEDIKPSELRGYKQCHFFAGIGVWSYALRSAGWPDDRPAWTGSCPCQPFSAAGKRKGTSDERHLWPAFNHLIGERKPAVVFGEQVASKDGLAWLDTVQTDMEGKDYAFTAVDICAAGFGAPHIRQRLYFVADSECDSRRTRGIAIESTEGNGAAGAGASVESGRCGDTRILADSDGGIKSNGHVQRSRQHGQQSEDGSISRAVEHVESEQVGVSGCARESRTTNSTVAHTSSERPSKQRRGRIESAGSATTGFWRDCDWLPCIDGKARPVEPGTFPLAHGVKNRVGLLRGYGNALVAPVAQGFIESYMEARGVPCV